MDNTHQMSTTMPSFNLSFKGKTGKHEGISLLINSRKHDQTSNELMKSKNDNNLFDSLVPKYRIPEDPLENFQLNSSVPSQSRNLNIFDNKMSENFCSKDIKEKRDKLKNINFYPEEIPDEGSRLFPSHSLRSPIMQTLPVKEIYTPIESQPKLTKKKSFELHQKSSFASDSIKPTQLFSKTPFMMKYSTQKKSYKAIHSKKSLAKDFKHQYNKSQGVTSKMTKTFKRAKGDYSVYLSSNQSVSATEKLALNRLQSEQTYSKYQKMHSCYVSVGETPKYSQTSSELGVSDDPRVLRIRHASDVDKFSPNLISMISPTSEHTAKTTDYKYFKAQPEVANYSINSMKTDFSRIHSYNVSIQKKLDNKLKKLEKKTSSIKEKASTGTYLQSKYLQISLDKEAVTEKRTKVIKPTKAKSFNMSGSKYSSKEKIFKNYWKNKTTRYSSSTFLAKKSPVLTSKKLSKISEKEINTSPSVKSKDLNSTKNLKNDRKKFLTKDANLGSFSKKLRSYNKLKSKSGNMTTRASYYHTRNVSNYIDTEDSKFSEAYSPTGKIKITMGQSVDLTPTLNKLR